MIASTLVPAGNQACLDACVERVQATTPATTESRSAFGPSDGPLGDEAPENWAELAMIVEWRFDGVTATIHT
jgi:hypothetical protein